MKGNRYEQWAVWLQVAMEQELTGCGIRPKVEYIPAVYKENENDPNGYSVMVSPEKLEISFVLPLEWRYWNLFTPKELSLEKARELASFCRTFVEEVWTEDFHEPRYIELFWAMPGQFEFYSERTPQMLYRITRVLVEKQIGPKNFRRIDLYEDRLIIYTRTGPFYVGYDHYRERMDEVLRGMRAFMRKPIRYEYLKELRRKRKDETDSNKG